MGKHFNYVLLALAAFSCASAICANHKNTPTSVSAAETTNTVEFNGSRPVVDSQYTYGDTTYWMTADENSGVKFDANKKLINFTAGGYMQNLTAMNGITKIELNITKGSIRIFKGWKQPSALETCMYDTDAVFVSGIHTITFNDKPNYFRLVAEEETSVLRVKVTRNNTSSVDRRCETLERGLENSYIDCGSLNKYANTAFTTRTCEYSSRRSLKVTFNNSKNNYFVLNPQRDFNAGNASSLLDVSRSTLTLRAKFQNFTDTRIRVKAIAEGWQDASDIVNMTCVGAVENGWQTYKLNFNDIRFKNSNNIIRLNFYFPGVNTNTIKKNAIVYLDNIKLKVNTSYFDRRGNEVLDEGLENSTVVDSEFIYSLTNSETFGYKSDSSMFLRPDVAKHPNYNNWEFSFSAVDNKDYWRFDEGELSFDYKPVNFANKTDVSLVLISSHDLPYYRTTIKGVETTDGWYRASLNLKQTGFETFDAVKCTFSFNITSAEAPNASVYLDNIRISEDSLESFTEGWENMARDEGWEKCDAIYDTVNIHSGTSINSLQLSFKDKDVSSLTRGCTILSPEQQKVDLPGLTNNNTLSAHFMFSDDVTNHTVRFFHQDNNWNGAYYDLTPTSEGNGWWQVEINKNTLPAPLHSDKGFKDYDFNRIGFGFPGITNENKNTAHVWVDDVMWTGNVLRPLNECTQGIAYNPNNSTNARKNISLPSKNVISESNPLSFTGAKNSVEGAELVFKANQDVRINFLPGRLMNSDGSGSVIQPNAFDVLFAKYVYNRGSKEYKHGYAELDDYPDALVPIDRIIRANENTISSGKSQLLWINVNIPKNIKSGTYIGYGTLIVGKDAYKVPMSVNVKKYLLSDENHSKSCFLIQFEHVQHCEGTAYYKKYIGEIQHSYYNFLADHRINPDMHSANIVSGEDFGEFIYEHVALNPKINTYRIPIQKQYVNDQSLFDKYISSLAIKQKELCDNNKDINLFDNVLLYMFDEPDEDDLGGSDFRNVSNNLKSAINKYKYLLEDYPYYQNEMINITNLVAINDNYSRTQHKNKIRPYFNAVCPEFNYFDSEGGRNMFKSIYRKVWWYGCCSPTYPYPSLEVDTPSYSERVASIMQYYYGIEGELYWDTVNVQPNDKVINKLGDVDVWNGYGAESIGDGRLMYPGQKYNICGPITTLRLEQLRLARQEYEFLYDIDENIYGYNRYYSISLSNVNEIIDSVKNEMFSGTKILDTWNADKMAQFHDRLLNILDAIH